MRQVIKLGLTLLFWATLSGAALALVYMKTSVQIERTKAENIVRLRREVLPQAVSFIPESGDGAVKGVDATGLPVGSIVSVNPKGYAGPIEMLVGVDTLGRVVSVRIVKQAETPGLGTRIMKDSFLNQYAGKAAGEVILKKDDATRGTIDAIAGATISSRAVTAGVREALSSSLDAAQEGLTSAEGTAVAGKGRVR